MKMNPTKYIKTEVTKEYLNFIFPAHQREVKDSSVKAIMESIKEHGNVGAISTRPSVEEPGKYEIFDGQHTFLACQRLNIEIVHNIFKDVSNRAIISINGKSRKWTMENYLKYGVTDSLEDYAFLDKVYKKERVPLTALIMMYGGNYANKPFKELKWKALTVKRGDKMLGYIKDYEKTYNIEQSRHARFVWGLGKVVDSGKYDHKRMMRQLSKCSQQMTKQANPEDYAKNIEMVYNYGLQDKNKVQFTQK